MARWSGAGGMIEWCEDGTCHLHLIGAMARVSPAVMKQCMEDEQIKQNLEEFIAKYFCECNEHAPGGVLHVMQENGQLLHVHSPLCSKYQKCNAAGQCKCRFEFGKPLCDPSDDKGAECVINEETGTWRWKLKRDHPMALSHTDQMYELHHACGGMPLFHHYAKFFGGSGADGQHVIFYTTNYTTKNGMPRLELKQLLLDVVQQCLRMAAERAGW